MKARCLLLAALLCAPILHAEDAWVAEAQVLVVSLPQDAALSLVPQLQDEKKSAAAMRLLFQQLANGSAECVALSKLNSAGTGAMAETYEEVRYPTEFGDYWIPEPFGSAKSHPYHQGAGLLPSGVETRNTGAPVELEASVLPDGKSVECVLSTPSCTFSGFDRIPVFPAKSRIDLWVLQPKFQSTHASSHILAPCGQWLLCGTFLQTATPGRVELRLLKVTTRRLPADLKFAPIKPDKP